jgi:hypothetical protein
VDSLRPAESSLELSKSEWIMLENIRDILQPFKEVTIRLQGQAKNGLHGALWEVLPAMQLLIKHLETSKTKYTRYRGLLGSLNNALKKLYEYYGLLTTSPVCYVAMSLNPAIKFTLFNREWAQDSTLQEDWVKIKNDIREYWLTRYKSIADERHDSEDVQESEGLDIVDKFIAREKEPFAIDSSVDDEYGFYCNSYTLSRTPANIVQYWSAQAVECPSLSQMALDCRYKSLSEAGRIL